MSTKIRVLSDLTINKIAAGEVIENPASVVKELVENSIDANATNISIEIAGGGRQLIRISDNGCGMVSDDALMCLERHATSKICNVEDIHVIDTMGFRGEAIPSIASISKFTLLTCPQGSEKGTILMVDGGKILSCVTAVRSPGTTVEVKSLFFNVPVRKKFQRSPAYDTNEILKMISLLALGHPSIQFELISDQKSLLSTPHPLVNDAESALSERITSLLGSDFSSMLLPMQLQKGGMVIRGFVGAPGHHRQNRSGQYLFINERAVFSPLISFAIRDGFGPTIPSQRHPIFVIHLTIPGSLVDVNVHPQKKEVRLRQESVIKDLMKQAVQHALQQTHSEVFFDQPTTSKNSLPWESFPSDFSHETLKKESTYSSHSLAKIPFEFPKIPLFEEDPDLTLAHPKQQESQQKFALPENPSRNPPKVITTLHQYILVDGAALDTSRQGLCLVDQVAARRRILFEKVMQTLFLQQQGPQEIQTLLIPHTIDLSPMEATLLRQHLDSLQRMGFSIQEFGPQTFVVEALPPYFIYHNISTALCALLQDIHQLEDTQQMERERARKMALAACKASYGCSKRMGMDEAQLLINQLMACEIPFQCPQGRQTIVYLETEELAKYFRK